MLIVFPQSYGTSLEGCPCEAFKHEADHGAACEGDSTADVTFELPRQSSIADDSYECPIFINTEELNPKNIGRIIFSHGNKKTKFIFLDNIEGK